MALGTLWRRLLDLEQANPGRALRRLAAPQLVQLYVDNLSRPALGRLFDFEFHMHHLGSFLPCARALMERPLLTPSAQRGPFYDLRPTKEDPLERVPSK